MHDHGLFRYMVGLSPRVRGNRLRQVLIDRLQGSIPACAGEPESTIPANRLPLVYPRVCGGTSKRPIILSKEQGLSPRVRGNRGAGENDRPAERSIPACAGEPYPRCRSEGARKVYPRVCGGTLPPELLAALCQGLSPRVRGNPVTVKSRLLLTRSIPACAGEPRAETAFATGPAGLSPRVRGNPCGGGPDDRRAGSIPACAGEPRVEGDQHGSAGVYPRVCGGTKRDRTLIGAGRGLSPRVRGNPGMHDGTGVVMWSIPACAGEPHPISAPSGQLTVYPRVCGGTRVVTVRWCRQDDLSPRVRGNPAACAVGQLPSRSIPACAGEPVLALARSATIEVYPRVCGGTQIVWKRLLELQGLSPRVRGNPDRIPYRVIS